ncbi:MAG TPA: hypothetical protein ENN86_02115 [Desulfobacteraceae bacterium]|nr:hypothetical protein [Desulfobacteraceae bacterium]
MKSRIIFSRVLPGIAFFAIAGLIFVWKMFFAPVKLAQEGAEIYIGKDALYEDVKDSLRVKGILVNEPAFDLLANRKRYVSGIKAGRYVISDDMSSNDIINLLRSGNQSPVHITFNNIRTLPDLSGRLGSQLAADSAGIHNALLDESLYSSEGFTRETIIAAFIPDTYEVLDNKTFRTDSQDDPGVQVILEY